MCQSETVPKKTEKSKVQNSVCNYNHSIFLKYKACVYASRYIEYLWGDA